MKELKPSRIVPANKSEVIPTEAIKPPPRIEQFFRCKRLGGYINLFAMEQITVEDDVVVDRKVITERDTRQMTLSKIMIKIEEDLK